MSSLDFVVRRAVARHPQRTALIEGRRRWTWRDFDSETTRAADALRSLGIGPGSRVAAAAFNSLEYFALYWGVARIGATLCPLNYLSAPDEMRFVLADLEPSVVLAAPQFRDQVAAALPEGASLVAFGAADEPAEQWAALLDDADPSADLTPPDPDSVHVILYTSGTTGRPKGVCHTQRAHYLDGLATALGYGIRPDDRYVVHAPSFHGASWDHAKILLMGDASVVVTPRFDPVTLMAATSEHRATILFGVPAVLRQLLDHPRWPEFDLSSVRLVYFGGALGSARVLTDFADALGRRIDYVQIYGLTEAGPFVSMADDRTVAAKPKSIGKPVPGVIVDVVDPDTGRPVPDGTPGELVVRSETVMAGYWRNPTATATALRDGRLHTGDLAVRDADGDLEIVDRIKDMVRTGGENVYAAEVERVLLEHPRITEAAVIGLPDERWDERVVACVIATPGADLDLAEVAEFCRHRLAAYKVPKQIEVRSAFPRTGVGKVAKHRLREELGGPGVSVNG